MAMDRFFDGYHRFRVQTEAFAALGARLSEGADDADPALLEALDAVCAASGLPAVDTLTEEQRSMLADMVRSSFRQSLAILEAPLGDARWGHTDVAVLDGQGRASTNLAPHIGGVVGSRSVHEILDVGTGVGLLAIALAEQWPDANVVGIDIWQPALDRAHRNVAGAGLGDRVQIYDQDVTTLAEVDRFDLAWLPAPFLPTDALTSAIPRVLEAVRPGGMVVIGAHKTPDDPLAAATQRLRNIADTGSSHTPDAVIELCHAAGFEATVLNPAATIPISLIGGRVP